MFLGTLAAVPLFMVVCGVFGKFRMGFVMGMSGFFVYLLAIVAKHGIGRGRPAAILENVHLRDVHASGLGFPSGHAAVSAALVVAALPYLPNRWRAPVLLFPAFMAFARIYVGAHLLSTPSAGQLSVSRSPQPGICSSVSPSGRQRTPSVGA